MMRALWVIGISFYLASCGQGDTYNRGYVISKSEVESELETSSPQEPLDPH